MPSSVELKVALDYLNAPVVNSAGQSIEAQKAARENLQDLVWALTLLPEFQLIY